MEVVSKRRTWIHVHIALTHCAYVLCHGSRSRFPYSEVMQQTHRSEGTRHSAADLGSGNLLRRPTGTTATLELKRRTYRL